MNKNVTLFLILISLQWTCWFFGRSFKIVRYTSMTNLFVDSSLHALLNQVHRYVVLTIIDAVKQNLTVSVKVSILQDSFYQFLYSRQIIFLKSTKLDKKSFIKKKQIIKSLDGTSSNCRILET